MSGRTGQDILDELAAPGRLLVFIDDGGTPGKPLPDLAADFELVCGVAMKSEVYAHVKKHMVSELRAIGNGVAEFHAVEIVNPESSSPWRAVSLAARQDALRKLIAILQDAVFAVLHCFVSGEQYDSELRHRIAALGVRPLPTKAALKHGFFNRLIPFFQATGEEVAIVVDSSKELLNAIHIQHAADSTSLYEGGVIHVDSRDEPGVQLADVAAYMVNRVHHSRQRLLDRKWNAFDELIIDGAFDLRPKFIKVFDASARLRLDKRLLFTLAEKSFRTDRS